MKRDSASKIKGKSQEKHIPASATNKVRSRKNNIF